MARPPRRRSLQPRLSNPERPSQDGGSKALPGDHPCPRWPPLPGRRMDRCLPPRTPRLPRRTEPAPPAPAGDHQCEPGPRGAQHGPRLNQLEPPRGHRLLPSFRLALLSLHGFRNRALAEQAPAGGPGWRPQGTAAWLVGARCEAPERILCLRLDQWLDQSSESSTASSRLIATRILVRSIAQAATLSDFSSAMRPSITSS